MGNYTEKIQNIKDVKKFLTTNEVQSFTSKNGKPSTNLTNGVLATIPFDGVTFYEKDDECSTESWIDTFWGKIIISGICLILFVFILLINLVLYYFIFWKKKR